MKVRLTAKDPEMLSRFWAETYDTYTSRETEEIRDALNKTYLGGCYYNLCKITVELDTETNEFSVVTKDFDDCPRSPSVTATFDEVLNTYKGKTSFGSLQLELEIEHGKWIELVPSEDITDDDLFDWWHDDMIRVVPRWK